MKWEGKFKLLCKKIGNQFGYTLRKESGTNSDIFSVIIWELIRI
jgi:hypothetical protein